MPGPLEDKRIAAALTPIGADGVGEQDREDTRYLAVQAEIDRLGSAGAGAVDWRSVRSNCLALLQYKTKDIRLGSYLTLSLLYTERLTGLAVGLAILDGLIRDFWPGLYPKAVSPRMAALSMVGERAAVVIQHAKLSADDIGPTTQVLEQLSGLRSRLEAVAGDILREREEEDGDGGLNPLWSRLQDYRARLSLLLPATPSETAKLTDGEERQEDAGQDTGTAHEQVATTTPPAQTVAAQEARRDTATSTASTTQKPAASSSSPPADLSGLTNWTREEAARLRAANMADSRSYTLLRVGEWLTYDGLALNNGKLLVGGPPQDRRARFAALLAGGQFAELVELAESTFTQRQLWLDLHRYTDQGLRGLGERHEPARRAVRGAVASLLVRLPELPKASFADGVAVADAETQAWLAEFMGGKAAVAVADPVADLLAAAGGLRVKGDVRGGLALFTAGSAAGGGRERFRRLLAQARFAFDAGMIGVVLPMLEELSVEAARLELAGWEPSLAADLYRLACQCLTHADATRVRPDPERRAALVSHRARLFRVDPAAALEFAKF